MHDRGYPRFGMLDLDEALTFRWLAWRDLSQKGGGLCDSRLPFGIKTRQLGADVSN